MEEQSMQKVPAELQLGFNGSCNSFNIRTFPAEKRPVHASDCIVGKAGFVWALLENPLPYHNTATKSRSC